VRIHRQTNGFCAKGITFARRLQTFYQTTFPGAVCGSDASGLFFKERIMPATAKPFLALTAGDLMADKIVRLRQDMSMRDAARLFFLGQMASAAVVDANGRCVGILAKTDFIRLGAKYGPVPDEEAGPPVTCAFREKQRQANGTEMNVCTLPYDVCPFQRTPSDGNACFTCVEPHCIHCVPTDWQVVNAADEVRQYMTGEPVMVAADEPIATLAQRMVDAALDRVIVVDTQGRPVGVVSSADVLAAVAGSAAALPTA
jgi:CBS domain-containing protein